MLSSTLELGNAYPKRLIFADTLDLFQELLIKLLSGAVGICVGDKFFHYLIDGAKQKEAE